MGRALFSKSCSTPAVRTEPEAIVDPTCQKWSISNKFDPDSDEFFVDAEYEAFIDPGRLHHHVDSTDALTIVSDGTASSASSDSTDSDAGSPMATGPDDPAELIASAVGRWDGQGARDTNAGWLTDIPQAPVQDAGSNNATAVVTGAEVADLSSLREVEERYGVRIRSYRPLPSSAGPSAPAPPAGMLTQTRTAGVQAEQVSASSTTPVAVSGGPSAASSVPAPSATAALPSYQTPSTPQQRSLHGATQVLVSPSPPPSVTPRFYSWQSPPIPAMPASPTAGRGNRDAALLTNPHARRSFARIGGPTAPALVANPAN